MDNENLPENQQKNPDNLPVKAPKARVPIVNGKFAPTDFDGLYRLAAVMTATPMVPEMYQDDPASAFVAMQMGMEVGLSFMASLQSIAVVKGKPTIYADGVTGLIQGSGHLEWMKEGFRVPTGDHTEDGEPIYNELDPSSLPANLEDWPDNVTAYCIMKRKGQEFAYKGSFSVADAQRMGKWNKPTKKGYKTIWQQYPARMMMWRARTFPARDGFSDVLKGLSVYEEVIDYDGDLEDTNGAYEVKYQEPVNNELFAQWIEDNGFNRDRVMRFLEESAKAADCPVEDVIASAKSDVNFAAKFQVWDDANSGSPVNDKSVSGSQNEESEPQGENGITVESNDPVNDSEKAPIDTLKDQLVIYMIDNEGINLSEVETDYLALLDEYIEYVAALTKKPAAGYVEEWARKGPGAYVKYFLGWIEDNDKAKESQTSGAAKDVEPSDSQEEKPLEGAPDVALKSFKSKWVGKTGKDFGPFVKENPEMFDPAVVGQEEYLSAQKKWNQLVYARTKEEWPYKHNTAASAPEEPTKSEPTEKKSEIEFPEQSVKQRFAELAMQNPDDMKKVLETRKFAKGGLSDAAMKIAVDDVLEILGGRVIDE